MKGHILYHLSLAYPVPLVWLKQVGMALLLCSRSNTSTPAAAGQDLYYPMLCSDTANSMPSPTKQHPEKAHVLPHMDKAFIH